MIQLNELRIGNWFWRNCCYDQVVEIHKKGIVGTDTLRGLISQKELNTIPLTEELLVKCGFSEYEFDEDAFLHNEEDVCVLKSGKVYYLYSFENSNTIGIPIRYLHQLQNIFFALTDKELEVML